MRDAAPKNYTLPPADGMADLFTGSTAPEWGWYIAIACASSPLVFLLLCLGGVIYP